MALTKAPRYPPKQAGYFFQGCLATWDFQHL
jgi:hypothetical protein